MKLSLVCISIAILLAALLPGCVHPGPILVDVSYQSSGNRGEESKLVVGISPFKDERGKDASVAGKRFNALNDTVNDLVVQGTVSEKVTIALEDALKARGIAVDDVAWNLTDANIPVGRADLVISGEVKTLWVESVSAFANTKVTAKVELRIVAADTAKKKIIRALNVSSSIEHKNVTYSTTAIDEAISEALSVAINQVFNDQELKDRLK